MQLNYSLTINWARVPSSLFDTVQWEFPARNHKPWFPGMGELPGSDSTVSSKHSQPCCLPSHMHQGSWGCHWHIPASHFPRWLMLWLPDGWGYSHRLNSWKVESHSCTAWPKSNLDQAQRQRQNCPKEWWGTQPHSQGSDPPKLWGKDTQHPELQLTPEHKIFWLPSLIPPIFGFPVIYSLCWQRNNPFLGKRWF